MTLNLTIANNWGIWQCSDHRLGPPASPTDVSIKHLIIGCPDGAALLAYAGAGRVGSVDISDWIRETLRGVKRSLRESFIQLRDNATRDLAPLLLDLEMHHMFSIGAFSSEEPWVIQIRNFQVRAGFPPIGPVRDRFQEYGMKIPRTGVGLYYGTPGAITTADFQKLQEAAGRKPDQSSDFHQLLSSMNRRAAETAAGRTTISPECMTSYIPPAGAPGETESYDAQGASIETTIPMLHFGVDMTELQKALAEQRVSPGSRESFQRRVEERANDAVATKNPLRDLGFIE